MKKGLPQVSIIWAYEGRDKQARLQAVRAQTYPGLEVIDAEQVKTSTDLIAAMSAGCEVCVFWADDEKPVGPDFIENMVRPLSRQTGMHFWSGNALAVAGKAVRALTDAEFVFTSRTFLRVMLPFLERGKPQPGSRQHVAVSSTERLAPLCIDAVGLPC